MQNEFTENIFKKDFLGDSGRLLEFQKRKDLPLSFVGAIK